jgi:phosphatidylinositol-3-phosphatase
MHGATAERVRRGSRRGAGLRFKVALASATILMSGTIAAPPAGADGAPPTIIGLRPDRGPVGAPVIISGSGFASAPETGAVAFGSVPAVYTVDSDTQISTVVPSGASTGVVEVTTPSGVATSPVPFEVKAPIVIVFMENQEAKRITPTNAPYLTGLAASQLQLSMYYANEHPSLPNYLMVASGSDQGKKGSDGVTAGSIQARSVWDQLSEAGVTWGVYQEGMSVTCSAALKRLYYDEAGKNQYAMKHNPAVPFQPVYGSAECGNDLDLASMPPVLTAVSFVTPSICNDMHGMADAPKYPADCQAKTDAVITRGDRWLSAHVPGWIAAGATVVVTFDEGNTGGLKRSNYSGGHVLTVVAGDRVRPGVDATLFNHFSLLAAVEDAYGLARLANAAAAPPIPLP